MEIIGTGFLARNFQTIAHTHPRVTVLAAGVSTQERVPDSAHQREATLVDDTIRRCADRGHLLVFMSSASASVYGSPGCTGREDEELVPYSPFGKHKLAMEHFIRASGVPYLILRVSHAVGPYQTGHLLVPALVRQILSGSVEVRRGARRDLIDVSHVVRIVAELLDAGVTNQVVNVASGVSTPIELIVDHLEAGLGVSALRRFVDSSSVHSVSVEKLRRLVPAIATMGFGPDYYRYVIDRYVEVMPRV